MPPFNLREQILKEHSKVQCASIVNWVGNSQHHFNELFNLFLNDEYRVVQRAAWPVSDCVIGHPYFIKKHFLDQSVQKNSLFILKTEALLTPPWTCHYQDTAVRILPKRDTSIVVQ